MSETVAELAEALDLARGEADKWRRLYLDRGEALAAANDRSDRLSAQVVALRRRLALVEEKPAAWEEASLAVAHEEAMATMTARLQAREAELARIARRDLAQEERLEAEPVPSTLGATEAAFRAAFHRQVEQAKDGG